MSVTGYAIITGGAQGIGFACAQALQADGLRPVLLDLNGEGVLQAAEQLAPGALGIACDVGDIDALTRVITAIVEEHGAPQVLVNNAGIAMPGDFLDYDIAAFQRVLAVNLTGAFAATQIVGKAMVAGGVKGAIINMSSINAQVAIPAIPAYCASKGGIMQLTKVAALALAPHGIRVNAVGPGSIDTAMLAGVNADRDAHARVMSRTPLGRAGAASEMGAVVAFLASEKASYVTGETIYADGGRLALNYTV